jgi:ABC-type transport system involved in multi-copper enzyme maturation permease subunit
VRLKIPFTYRHDLRHSLTSRATIAVVALSILAGAASLITVESATPYFSIGSSALYYYDNGAYHLLVWVYDAGGTPVSGVIAEFTALTGGTQNTTSGPYPVTSNSQGEMSLVIPVADQSSANLTIDSVQLPSTRSVTALWGGLFASSPPFLPSLYLGYISPGVTDGIDTLAVAGTNYYSAHAQAMAFVDGPNGSTPTGLRLETCSTPQSSFSYYGPDSCAGLPTQGLGPVTGFWTRFPLPEYPLNATTVFVQLVNESGGIVQVGGNAQVIELRPAATTGNESSVVASAPGAPILRGFATEMSFFLPAMAIITAYWVYARPRLSGTVEPVLAGPVTRRGLLLTRYASVAGVLTAAAIAEVLILDAGVSGVLGEPLPVSFLAPLIGGLLVAALGSAGLIFLLSHVVRSPGAVLGTGIVTLAMGFFWSNLVLGLLILSNPLFSGLEATTLLLPSQLFFPPQFSSLTTSLLTGLSPFGTPLGPSPSGVNFAIEAAIGIVWVVVPVLITYRLATTRD